MNKEDEDIFKYILVMSSFYEKVIANHPKKEQLQKAIRGWKQQAHSSFSKTQEDDTLTIKSKARTISPQKFSILRLTQTLLPEFTVFAFKDQNDFLRVFSYSFLVVMITTSGAEVIQALNDEISRNSNLLDGTSFAQTVAARKITLLISYLVKVRDSNSSEELRAKIEAISNEDKTILSKIVKVLIVSRRQSLASSLTDLIPSESTFKSIAEILNITLVVYEIRDDYIKSVYGKGAMDVYIAYSKNASVFMSLSRKKSPAISRSNSKNGPTQQLMVDKISLFNDLLNKFATNSEQLGTLKTINKAENWQDINIKQKLKKFVKK